MSVPKLDVRHLQLVQAIAEEGSVTRAGLRLHLTQSALSHQLRDAEERLAFALRPHRPAAACCRRRASACSSAARAVLAELERAELEIGQSDARGARVIRLDDAVQHRLPLAAAAAAALPADASRCRRGGRGGSHRRPDPGPARGAIDLAVVHRPVRDSRIRLRPLFKDEMVVVLPPGHRLSRAPFVAAEDLAPEQLILYSIPREANLVFRDVLIPAGVPPRRVTHIQLTEAIVEMVKAGLGRERAGPLVGGAVSSSAASWSRGRSLGTAASATGAPPVAPARPPPAAPRVRGAPRAPPAAARHARRGSAGGSRCACGQRRRRAFGASASRLSTG